jgi:hypothetical protein
LLAIVAELEQAGWVDRREDGFQLGASAHALGGTHSASRLSEVLLEAVEDLGHPVNYFRVLGDELVVAGVQPQQPGAWHVTVGQRLPLIFPSGAASMPLRTEEDLRRWARTASGRAEVELALRAAEVHGCVFFAPDASERSFDDVLRQLLGTIRNDEIPEGMKERLHAQLIRLTSVPCSVSEVESDDAFPVSYAAAPVRHAGGAIHELHVVVLGEALSREARDDLRRALGRWTAALAEVAP